MCPLHTDRRTNLIANMNAKTHPHSVGFGVEQYGVWQITSTGNGP